MIVELVAMGVLGGVCIGFVLGAAWNALQSEPNDNPGGGD